MILTEQERARMNELRDGGRTLTDAEQAELQVIFQKIEDAEAVYLAPANERRMREIHRMEERITRLKALNEKRRSLAERLEKLKAEKELLDYEEAEINEHYPRVKAHAAV